MIRVRARDVRPSRVGVWRHGDAAPGRSIDARGWGTYIKRTGGSM